MISFLTGEALNTTSVLCRVPAFDRIGTYNITIEDALQTERRWHIDTSAPRPERRARDSYIVSQGATSSLIDGANFVEGSTACPVRRCHSAGGLRQHTVHILCRAGSSIVIARLE